MYYGSLYIVPDHEGGIIVGILRYESLAHFWSEYRPQEGYPQLIVSKRNQETGFVCMVVQLEPGPSFALICKESETASGKAYITDDINKLLPLYRHLS